MSLTSAMSIALSGLSGSMSLISLTSNNISNAQTAGYTTKSALLSSVDYGTNPGGVSYNGFKRATDDALTKNLNLSTTDSSYYNTLNTYMTQVQSVLDASSDQPALSADVAAFASAWSQYSSNPESSTAQSSVINAGNTLAKAITTISTQLTNLKGQVTKDITSNVSGLNTALKKVASLNIQIQEATTAGLPTGDLQDSLDTAVKTVAAYNNVNVQSRANGQIALYTTSGQPLVDASSVYTFSYNTNTNVLTDQNGNDVTSAMNGGSLDAAIKFLSTSAADAASTVPGVGALTKLTSQLQALVSAFTSASSAFATAYSSAVTTSTAATGTQSGATVASTFFTVTTNAGVPDLNTFAVNSSLLNSSAVLPQMTTSAIADSFDSTASYTASGLSINTSTYSDLTTAILANAQQTASTVKDSYTTAKTQTDYFQTQLSNETGVNLDEQLANLTMYQNGYAASAHVISTVKTMIDTLLNIV